MLYVLTTRTQLVGRKNDSEFRHSPKNVEVRLYPLDELPVYKGKTCIERMTEINASI